MCRRTGGALACMLGAIGLLALAVLEISFPEILSVTRQVESLGRYRMHLGLLETALAFLLVWPSFKLDALPAGRTLETALRLGVGGMFVGASWYKIQDPQGFAILVAQYQFLPQGAINLFALFMPQLELWAGLLLIFTRWNKEMSLLILGMFVAFIAALAQAVVRDLGITCGCFEIEGAMSKKDAWISLVRDLILLGPNLWLAFRPNRSLVAVWERTKK